MNKYIEKAKGIADQKRAEVAAAAAAHLEKQRIKDEKIGTTIGLLKRELQQWEEVGFFYTDSGREQHQECASIGMGGSKILGFRCTFRGRKYEYGVDVLMIEITYYNEPQSKGLYVTEEIDTSPDPARLVDACMDKVAVYLSKFM